MLNMNNKKTRQRVSAAIVLVLVLAMLVPILAYLVV
jgi:hypothetical protein